MIWDDHQSRSIGEMSFKSNVLNVLLKRDRVVVVTIKTVHVYNFKDLKLIDHIETINNPLGLCSISPSSTSSVLACLGKASGQIRVELYDLTKSTQIQAHESEVVALVVNQEGTLVATASEKGTLIRVFDTSKGTLVHELRRGAERAVIHCICIHPSSLWLACSSDKGTVHIFSLKQNKDANSSSSSTNSNAVGSNFSLNNSSSNKNNDNAAGAASGGGSWGLLQSILPKYFSSEWSYAQFRISDTSKTICCFGAEKNTIIVIGVDTGTFYKASFEKVCFFVFSFFFY